MRSAVAAVILAIAAVAPAFGFNELGHKLVAKAAYDRLSAAERAQVFAILAKHPHYAAYLATGKPADVDPQEWALMNAAYWADWIRPPEGFPEADLDAHWRHKFHRGNWHYVNYPYAAHQTNLTLDTPLPGATNILRQLELCESYLKGATAEDPGIAADVTAEQNRAVRLCWLFHLAGDLHQPLHTVALVQPGRLARGDQGGNLLAVKKTADRAPLRLHAYWDGVLGDDSDYAAIVSLAKELAADEQLTPGKLAAWADHKSYLEWAQESYELAANFGYLNGDLPVVLWSNDQDAAYRSGVPTLTASYQADAVTITRRRVALAGYRLAEKLREIVGSSAN